MDTLPAADRTKQNLAEQLRSRDLMFLCPLLKLELDLNVQMSQPDMSAKTLYAWLKDNVDPSLAHTPGFVNVLFTAVTRYVIDKSKEVEVATGQQASPSAVREFEKEQLSKFSELFARYMSNRVDLQLAALYALQTVCHELKFPKGNYRLLHSRVSFAIDSSRTDRNLSSSGLLLRWFNALYDQEIVDEEAFLKWKEDINDEFPGKGQALFQVNTWLTWLAETEETESEEDDATD